MSVWQSYMRLNDLNARQTALLRRLIRSQVIPSPLNITDQQFEPHVEAGNHHYVALLQLAAVRFINPILIFAKIAEQQGAVRLIGDAHLFARFEVGRVDALNCFKV